MIFINNNYKQISDLAHNKSHKMVKIFKKQNKRFYQRKNKINNKIAKE